MAQKAAAALRAVEDVTIVDTDVHLTYNEEVRRQVASYMDPPYDGYVDPDASEIDWGYQQDGWPKDLGGTRDQVVDEITDAATIQTQLCDTFGVDIPIINIGITSPDNHIKTERGLAEMRGINDFLIDQILDENDDFYGLATIGSRKPHKIAEEIDRVGSEKQIVGTYFLAEMEFSKPAGDPEMDIVYQAISDNDLVPTFHISGMHRQAPLLRRLEKVAAWYALGLTWSMEVTVTSLIFGEVPEKFPDLEFVCLEGGISGWIPRLMSRLNREYAQFKGEFPLLEKTPEEYIRESFHFATQPIGEFNDPRHMRQILEIIGPELLMFSTDYPHFDFDHPSTVTDFLRDFSDEEQEMVLSGNAMEVFDI